MSFFFFFSFFELKTSAFDGLLKIFSPDGQTVGCGRSGGAFTETVHEPCSLTVVDWGEIHKLL